jgi:hypothetical protein
MALIAFIGILGCNKPDQKQVQQPARNQDQEPLEAANRTIQELSAQVERLRIDNQRLKTKNEFLTKQNEILNPRLQQLIAFYGTGIWDYREDDNSPVFVKSMKGADVQSVIAELNEGFQRDKHPKLIIEKKEDRTVYVGVDDNEQLGERMGSNGALSYMTSVTFSLISVSGIDCVFLDIDEGDHASPGKYCRDRLEPLEPQ